MKKKTVVNAIIFILIIAVSGVWGYLQPIWLPSEKYGTLYIITAMAGGAVIGFIGGWIYSLID
jgi:quinol-cytochrome oxidoreductase complex cytochrome b subunit